MSADVRWRAIKKAVVLSGTAMIVIGVVLVAFSERILPIGIFFLVTGCVGVLTYLLSTLVKCFKMPTATTARSTEGQATERGPQGQHQEGINSIYDVPAYEEVVAPDFQPPLGIWIISPARRTSLLGEPPPYSVIANEPIDSNGGQTVAAQSSAAAAMDSNDVMVAGEVMAAHGADSDHRLHLRIIIPPKLQRFKSDIHDMKGVQEVPVHLEPMTPPPSYQDTLEDEVFEEDFRAAL